jgi:hypothetical protein
LPVADWWAELDAKLEEAERMESKMNEIRNGGKNGTVFGADEWAEARRKHAEKKAGRK